MNTPTSSADGGRPSLGALLHDDARAVTVRLDPPSHARRHAERLRTVRRTAGASVVAVAAAAVVATAALWPLSDEDLGAPSGPPHVTLSPAPTSSPSPTATLPVGLPVLLLTDDPIVDFRDVGRRSDPAWAVPPCELEVAGGVKVSLPADALMVDGATAAGMGFVVHEQVVMMADAGAATNAVQQLVEAYDNCPDASADTTRSIIPLAEVGDEAVLLTVDNSQFDEANWAVLVRVDEIVAMYAFDNMPGQLTPTNLEETEFAGLVDEFVTAVRAG